MDSTIAAKDPPGMIYTLKRFEAGVPQVLTFSTSLDGLLSKIGTASPMTEELRAIGLEIERIEVCDVGDYSLGNGWSLSVTKTM